MSSGLVVFPHGDVRNCTWVCGLNRNQQDAFTTGPADPHASYEADWSGGWRYRDSEGNFVDVYPDGSAAIIGNGGAVPTTYRHVVTDTQARERVPFTQAARRPVAASPMPWVLHHATGATVTLTASGAVAVSAAAGQAFSATANGGSVTISASGAVSLTAETGQTATLSANGASVQITATGGIVLTPVSGQVVTVEGTLNVTASLGVSGTVFSSHEHTNTQPGTGNTGPVYV
jgi:hypothetical protein